MPNEPDCDLKALLEWSQKLGDCNLEEITLKSIPTFGNHNANRLSDTIHLLWLHNKKAEKKLSAFSKLSTNTLLGVTALDPEDCANLIANELRVSETVILVPQGPYHLPNQSCFLEHLNTPITSNWLNAKLDSSRVLILNHINTTDTKIDSDFFLQENIRGSHCLFARIGKFNELFLFHRCLGSPEFTTSDYELVLGLANNIDLIQKNDELYIDLLNTKNHLDKINSELTELNASLEQKVQIRTRDLKAEKKRAQQAQVLAENANRSKSDFLAMISHEIRTPLNGVVGMAQLMETTPLTEEQQSYIQTIQSASQLLLTLISDILDYAKIEAGQMEIEETPIVMAEISNDLVGLLSHMAHNKGLEFTIDIHGDIPEIFLGDNIRLRQILINLCNNAIKFTEHGFVKLQVTLQKNNNPSAESLLFAISDTGIGISETDIEKLFQPFVQANASTARIFGGTGLGLVISKQLVTAMNGEIGVESKVGKGSRFWFNLPFKAITKGALDDHLKKQKAKKEFTNRLHSMITTVADEIDILVVEDNSVNQITIEALLKKEGLTCHIAETGDQAISAFKRQPWTLIFMDYMLPDMTGVDVTKALRSYEQANNLKPTMIIALSANTMAVNQKQYSEAGMNYFIEKPIKREQLQHVLNIATSPKRS